MTFLLELFLSLGIARENQAGDIVWLGTVGELLAAVEEDAASQKVYAFLVLHWVVF